MVLLSPYISYGSVIEIQCTGGSAFHDNNTNNWTTVRDSATGTGVDNSGSVYVMAAVSGGNYKVYRGFLSCDTSAIPDDATVDAATLELKGSDKFGALSESYTLYESSHADTITTGDYSARINTAISNDIALASWSNSATNTFTLNATGLAYLNLSGTTDINVSEKTFDVLNSTPSGAESGVAYWLNSSGFPVLEVTYTEGSGGEVSTTTASTTVSVLEAGDIIFMLGWVVFFQALMAMGLFFNAAKS